MRALAIRHAGLPLTVRAHGFEFTRRRLSTLQRCPAVQAVYLFPHLARTASEPSTVRAMNTAFNGDLYYPVPTKDRRLVLRTAAGVPTKDLQTFIDVARKCPDHRFVLVLARCNEHESFLDEVSAYNLALGSPVELRTNQPAETLAAMVRAAGIYLHTDGRAAPYGMPISIAEAMATGSYVIGRRCRASEAYIGSAGGVYDSPNGAAALIRRTTTWTEERWKRANGIAVARAYRHFADIHVLRPMLEDWRRIAGSSAAPSLGVATAEGLAPADHAGRLVPVA